MALAKRYYKDKGTQAPSLYPQGYFKDKACKWCDDVFPPTGPSNHYCSKDCKYDGRRDSYYKKAYGIGLKDVQQMLKDQDGKCAICGSGGYHLHEGTKRTGNTFSLDHCHSTGKVRGLLCADCNRALGLFKDNVQSLQNAIAYLEGSTTIPNGSTLEAIASGSGEHTTT